MKRIFTLVSSVFLCCSLMIISCSKQKTNTVDNKSTTMEDESVFSIPTPPPMMIDAKQRATYSVEHIWDTINLKDSSLTNRDEFEQFLVDFVSIAHISDLDAFRSAIKLFFKQADSKVKVSVSEFMEKYLDDPNSPLRYHLMNVEAANPLQQSDLYFIFMDEALKDGEVNYQDSVRYEYKINLYHKNKPGTLATDFKYITSDGAVHRLHTTNKGDYTILMFYNPGCPACLKIEEGLDSNKFLQALAKENKIQILLIYPDYDLKLWKKYLDRAPRNSIVGRDPQHVLLEKELYDLEAMPTLYLLDKDKKVILRDAPLELVVRHLFNIYNS